MSVISPLRGKNPITIYPCECKRQHYDPVMHIQLIITLYLYGALHIMEHKVRKGE